MNRRTLTWITRSLLAAATLVVSATHLAAQDSAAKVIHQQGQVSIADGGYLKALNVGDQIRIKQLIMTGPDGYARFQVVSDGSTFEVFPNSKVFFRSTPGSWENLLDIVIGRIKVFIQHAPGIPNPNKVTSPTAVISVRGTVFDVVVGADESTFVTVDEGEVAVRNWTAPGNSAILKQGDSITVYRGVPLFGKQIDKGNIFRKVLAATRDIYWQVGMRRAGGSGPIGSGPTGGGAQGDKGKDTTSGPGAPPAGPGAPPAAPGGGQ
jgi:ferric-dicitrate binding protein FerR (iron transport regulator)